MGNIHSVNYNVNIKDVFTNVKCNIWYDYLMEVYKSNLLKGENWIDFESEISLIIETLDRNTISLQMNADKGVYDIDPLNGLAKSKYEIFKRIVSKNIGELRIITMGKLRKTLYDDLERLNKALGIYLNHFVEKININIFSDDILKIQPDYVLNFNYTNTYETVYGGSADVFHIHGSCKTQNGKDNNMVLGIDEYLEGAEKNNHTNFTIFKKFAQRIQKRVGVDHIKFYNDLSDEDDTAFCDVEEPNQVYIFGHSLDVTDKDILKPFFLGFSKRVINKSKSIEVPFEVTVFCKDAETEGEYIANIIKIIDEDTLIEKVNKNPPDIKFVIQSEMIEGKPNPTPKTTVPAT